MSLESNDFIRIDDVVEVIYFQQQLITRRLNLNPEYVMLGEKIFGVFIQSKYYTPTLFAQKDKETGDICITGNAKIEFLGLIVIASSNVPDNFIQVVAPIGR